jgi:hypothetical protein
MATSTSPSTQMKASLSRYFSINFFMAALAAGDYSEGLTKAQLPAVIHYIKGLRVHVRGKFHGP